VVTLEPVRVLDSRDPVNVGLAGPFVSPVSQDLKVTGSIPTTTGTKTVVPAGATGVFLNVTPVGSTAAGFISVRPANAAGSPSTSNVNFTVGASNPNAVLVELPVGGADDGKIEITFDAFGAAGPTTDVLVDVVGYTTDTRLKALEASVAALEAKVAPLVNSVAATSGGDQRVTLTTTDQIIRSVSLMPPANGVVLVNSSSYFYGGSGLTARCSLTTGTAVDYNYLQIAQVPSSDYAVTGGTRGFDVTKGVLLTVNLVCDSSANVAGEVNDTNLTAIFAPG